MEPWCFFWQLCVNFLKIQCKVCSFAMTKNLTSDNDIPFKLLFRYIYLMELLM